MNYEDSYVAFIDILGFSSFVENHSFDEVHNVIAFLRVEENASWSGLYMKYSLPKDSIKILVVSDSIIISIKKNIEKSLESIIWICAVFQATLLLNSQQLMRGGIACGDFFIDGTILFGKGYLKAVNIEKSHSTPKIVIDESINIDNLSDSDYISKDDEDNKLFVDYMKMVVRAGATICKIPKVKKLIIDSLIIFKDKKNFLKYKWLKKQYNKTLCENNKFTQFIIAEEETKHD